MLQMDLGQPCGRSFELLGKTLASSLCKVLEMLNDARHHHLVTDSYLASLETPARNEHVFGWRWAGTHPDRHIRRELCLVRVCVADAWNMTIIAIIVRDMQEGSHGSHTAF